MEVIGLSSVRGRNIRGMDFSCCREFEHFAKLLNANHHVNCGENGQIPLS